NRRLLSKKVGWDWSGVWRIAAENQNKIPPARERSERVPSSENSQCLTWSGRRELNPLPLGPKPSVLPMNYSPRRRYSHTVPRACEQGHWFAIGTWLFRYTTSAGRQLHESTPQSNWNWCPHVRDDDLPHVGDFPPHEPPVLPPLPARSRRRVSDAQPPTALPGPLDSANAGPKHNVCPAG
ncbi:MAG: hypothetical protein G01um101438_970, partial [Parcubacteria group bacterium Gr01-1014_38]